MTEQTGQNSEVLQDLPAVHAGADPQPDSCAGRAEHDPDAGRRLLEAGPVAGNGDAGTVRLAEPGPAPSARSGRGSPLLRIGRVRLESLDVPSVAEAASPAACGSASKPAKPARPRAESAQVAESGGGRARDVPDVPKSENMNWYILKVQSNREESIREGLLRRVSIQGLDRFFGEVIVPTEKVTEFKGGKKRVIKRKLYPGYIVVHMEINEDTWFLVRETPGIGDFTGASGVPTPMLPHEVERIIAKQEEKSEKAPDLKIPFAKGDRVKVIEGNFENFEGEVDAIDKTNGRVTVMITIFNRTTPVEFEYWQVESV